MPKHGTNNDFMLGEMSAKVNDIHANFSTFALAFREHTLSDERNFKEIKDELTGYRVRLAKYIGAVAVITSAIGLFVPPLVNFLFK